jgi:hypothetical protein
VPVKRYNKERDCRFDDWRRNSIPKAGVMMTLPLYSTDLDCVEFTFTEDGIEPVALIEKKSVLSSWLIEWRASMKAHFIIASRAQTPYYVAEHTEDRSDWIVYLITTTDRLPCKNDIVLHGVLFDYVMFLCELHGYEPPQFFIDALKKVIAISPDGKSILER